MLKTNDVLIITTPTCLNISIGGVFSSYSQFLIIKIDSVMDQTHLSKQSCYHNCNNNNTTMQLLGFSSRIYSYLLPFLLPTTTLTFTFFPISLRAAHLQPAMLGLLPEQPVYRLFFSINYQSVCWYSTGWSPKPSCCFVLQISMCLLVCMSVTACVCIASALLVALRNVTQKRKR